MYDIIVIVYDIKALNFNEISCFWRESNPRRLLVFRFTTELQRLANSNLIQSSICKSAAADLKPFNYKIKLKLFYKTTKTIKIIFSRLWTCKAKTVTVSRTLHECVVNSYLLCD